MINRHKTIKVFVEEEEIDIDEKLAPLIPLLWEEDIETIQCCQEYRTGLACIEFPCSGDVEQFLSVAQRPYRVEVETWDEGTAGRPSIRVRLLVLFPIEDIPYLVKTFEQLVDDQADANAEGSMSHAGTFYAV